MVATQSVIGVAIERQPGVKPKNSQPKKSRFRADRLADLMRIKGLNQGELAKFAGVDASQVSRWLSGTNIPTVDTLAFLADYFQVSADYLLDRVGENVAYYTMPELSPDEWEFVLSIRDGSLSSAFHKLAEYLAKQEEEAESQGHKDE